MTARSKITLLTFFFAMCGTVALVTAWLQQRADANVKPADLYVVVERQLGDFRGGDYPHAYEYASQAVQARYSEEQFATMVQTEYPGMTNVSRVEYGEVRAHGSHATIQVYLVNPDGGIMPCVYMMIREAGLWHIDGARLMQSFPPNMRMDGIML
jgi:hypothetical protein